MWFVINWFYKRKKGVNGKKQKTKASYNLFLFFSGKNLINPSMSSCGFDSSRDTSTLNFVWSVTLIFCVPLIWWEYAYQLPITANATYVCKMCGAKVICEMLIRRGTTKKQKITLAVPNDLTALSQGACGYTHSECVLTCGIFDKYSRIIKCSNYSKELIVGSAF